LKGGKNKMTKQIPRATLKEIAEEMRKPEYRDSSEAIGFKVLEEELWGFETGIYKPIAEISLPVIYGGQSYQATIGADLIQIPQVLTEFNERFFKGHFPAGNYFDGIGLPPPVADYWDTSTDNPRVYSEADNKDPEEVLREHVKSFLAMQGASKESLLVRKCLREF